MNTRIMAGSTFLRIILAGICVTSALGTSATGASLTDFPASIDRGTAVVAERQQSTAAFLGFESGEERRYALGPPEELYAGERATWAMRLREVFADPPHAIFELAHVWDRGRRTQREFAIGTVTHVQSAGELRVNAHGFPLEMRFETERHLAGMGEEIYSVRYRFEDGGYMKHIAAGGRDLEHRTRHLSNDDLDLDIPGGMYPFGAAAMACLLTQPPETTYAPGVLPGRPGGGNTPPVAPTGNVRFAAEVTCKEPLFANPGLLSLMLPALWEAGTGELEFVVLTPAGYFGMPGVGGGGALPGMSVMMQNRPFDSQEASHPRTNSDIEELRYRDRVRVDVGVRTLDAWLFEGMRDFDAVYVDDDGVVLRVDLAAPAAMALPRSGALADVDPGLADQRDLWIRLLFASEY